jgi:DDE superfamily endonuclease
MITQHILLHQLSKDIKAGKLPKDYHVVLDEAYPCTEQEMSPWKGRNLNQEKDAFNYYMSLNRQVIERAFGILIQRWGIFWRPLRLSMHNRGVVIQVACKLHNICIEDSGYQKVHPMYRNSAPEFDKESDYQPGDDSNVITFTDGTPIRQGFRSDLEQCTHREQWTETIVLKFLVKLNFIVEEFTYKAFHFCLQLLFYLIQ